MKKAFSNLFVSIIILVFLASEIAVAALVKKTTSKHISTPPSSIESRLAGGRKWKEQSVNDGDGVFTRATEKPDSEPWNLPVWLGQTVPPWLDTDSSVGVPFEEYNSPRPREEDEDLNIDVVMGLATPARPDVPPVHVVVDGGSSSGGGGVTGGDGVPNLWADDEARMGGYTWITMAVVLVVFFKMTVIAIAIARRMRQRQHQALAQTANSSSINIPSEFASDQAHLVTPASIVFIDPNDDRPAPLPNLFNPPPYSESLLAHGGPPPPATPVEAPPPYSG